MFNTVFNSYAEQSKAFFSPLVKFNETVSAHVEKLADLQIATFNEYAELSLKQFKEAVAIKDLESLQGYTQAQLQSFSKLGQKALDDSKKFVELGTALKDDLVKLGEQNSAELSKKVAEMSDAVKNDMTKFTEEVKANASNTANQFNKFGEEVKATIVTSTKAPR